MRKLLAIIFIMILATINLSGCGQKEEITVQKSDEEENTVGKENATASETSIKDLKSRFIFTANEEGSISKIDSVSNQLIETFTVEGVVHNVQVSPNGLLLGAAVIPASGRHDGGHSDHHSESTTGKAVFYDTNSNELIKAVEVGHHPAHIVFTNDGKYALVTNNKDNNVSVIDLKDYTVAKTIPTGKEPHGFRISTDSKYAFIANMGEDTVSVVNMESFVEEKKMKVGSTPVTTAVTSDDKILLATLHTENAVAIVDLVSGETKKVYVGDGPAQVFIQSDNQFAFVANQGTVANPSNSVTKINLTTKEVDTTIETGKGAHGVVTSYDNQYVYVTNMFENTVSVIDNSQNKVIRTITVGKVPNGISVKP